VTERERAAAILQAHAGDALGALVTVSRKLEIARRALNHHAMVRLNERGALHASQDKDPTGCKCRWCLTREALAP
jgi:hypothetical protein